MIQLHLDQFTNRVIKADCCQALSMIPDQSIDLLFADPPFNLGRSYGLDQDQRPNYKEWVHKWIDLAIPKLSVGGIMVVHHRPVDAIWIAYHMQEQLTFQNWITWKTANMPISNRLLPEHFVFLVFSNGKPRVFNAWGDTVPHRRCRKCGEMIADWGGKKRFLKPEGKRVSDVWTDIERLRHSKNKHRSHNELPLNAMERLIKLYTNDNDVVLDLFLGTGTTAVAAKRLKRRFIGIEMDADHCLCAEERLKMEAPDGTSEEV